MDGGVAGGGLGLRGCWCDAVLAVVGEGLVRYAEHTAVSVEKSKAEIERTLTRYGASKFMNAWDEGKALIVFEMNSRRIRFVLPLPDRKEKVFWNTPGGRKRRNEAGALEAWEQACRQRWRALGLAIKAKLEAVETGITTFDEEFLAHIVLPNNQTVGEWMVPQVSEIYLDKKMPPMLTFTGKA